MKTDRLLLRRFNEDDLENVFKGLSHPDIIPYYGVRYDSLEATKAQMTFFDDLEKNETGFWWAICSLDNTVFYGAGGLNSLSKEHKKAEIGFWLLPEYWGKGYATETSKAVLEYAFNEMKLDKVFAYADVENGASNHVLRKLGFDPASASAPFVATLVDVTGLVIYFTVASWLLTGTLL